VAARSSTDRPRSPLALVLLALLAEAPMHPYRMQQLIHQRGKDKLVNVAQRYSVYQLIERLRRDGLITVSATGRAERRPERTVYAITPAGRRTLDRWLATILSQPPREFPDFPAALSFVTLLQPQAAAGLLEARTQALTDRLAALDADADIARASQVSRVFLIEDEYQRAMLQAELDWVRALLDDLRAHRLDWNDAWLREQAAAFEAATAEPGASGTGASEASEPEAARPD
jgi:DNA-binding PadR family transcriptional regulator